MQPRRPRVLIVDDDLRTATALARWLEVRGQLEVMTVATADAALDELDREPFDLLVSDLTLPVNSGPRLLELCERRWPNMRRAIITGAIDYPRAAEAVLLKGDDPESNGAVLIALARGSRGA